MKGKRWMVAACIAALLLGIWVFREPIGVYFAPKLVLSRAIQTGVDDLRNRFSDSPLHEILPALDTQGQQEIGLRLDTCTGLLGTAHYNLTIHTQGAPKRILTEGTVIAGGSVLDLSLFLDGECAAVSSESLTAGKYYGVQYADFSWEMQSWEWLAFFLGRDTVEQWSQGLDKLETWMEGSLTIPNLELEGLRTVLMGFLALDPEVIPQEHGYAIGFCATGQALSAAAEPYMDRIPGSLKLWIRELEQDPESQILGTFFLEQGSLTGLDVFLAQMGSAFHCEARLEGECLTLRVTLPTGATQVSITTRQDGKRYYETIQVQGKSETTLEYSWDSATGELYMALNGTPVRGNLTGEGATVKFYTADWEALLGALTGDPKGKTSICTLTLSPGSAVPVPAYRSMEEWSVEDLMVLLQGFGSLLGLGTG